MTYQSVTDYAVSTELPVVHMTKINIQHQLMMQDGIFLLFPALVIHCQ